MGDALPDATILNPASIVQSPRTARQLPSPVPQEARSVCFPIGSSENFTFFQ